jgi:hypothetical protein
MTTHPKSRPNRSLAAGLGALALLLGLAVPSQAQAQVRSGVASIALTADAAPGVRATGTTLADRPVAGGAVSDLAGMSVNTAYRIELRGSGARPVVLLQQDKAGLVPWDQVRALVSAPAGAPVVLDLVLAPTL